MRKAIALRAAGAASITTTPTLDIKRGRKLTISFSASTASREPWTIACNTVLKRHPSAPASTKARKAVSGTALAGQHRHESGKELPKSAAQLFELASELFRTSSELLMRSQPRFRVTSELLKWISEVFKTALEGLKPATEFLVLQKFRSPSPNSASLESSNFKMPFLFVLTSR